MVILENMARGLPVIASDIGAFEEVMHGAGLCFKTGDADELASRLAEVLQDQELSARLSASSRRRAAELSVEGMVEGHARIYRRLAGAASREAFEA